MLKPTKIPLIVLVLILILIAGGIIYWSTLSKEKHVITPPVEKEEIFEEEELPETFTLNATISKINVKDNYLLVKPIEEEKEIKVILNEDTEITRLKFPFDPKNPPLKGTFTLEKEKISIDGLKVGDQILIKTNINIAGKKEFDDVIWLQVMP